LKNGEYALMMSYGREGWRRTQIVPD